MESIEAVQPASKSYLNALSPELFDMIAAHLEHDDLASLRQTSLNLDGKVASQNRYADKFISANIHVDSTDLELFAQVTQGRMCHLIRHVTITGVHEWDVALTPGDAARHQQLLTDAFKNAKQSSLNYRITSLRLTVAACYRDSNDRLEQTEAIREWCDWRPVWDAAQHTFKTTMAALGKSKLQVEQEFDVFSSVKGCSLAFSDFLSAPHSYSSLGFVFKNLKILKLSLAAPKDGAPPGKDGRYEKPEVPQESPATRIAKAFPNDILRRLTRVVSRLMPNVTDVDWHWFNMSIEKPRFSSLESNVSEYPRAKPRRCKEKQGTKKEINTSFRPARCALRGLFVSTDDLLWFLQSIRPVQLTLQRCNVLKGDWGPILKYLTSNDCSIKHYHLDHVARSRKTVHFFAPRLSKVPQVDDFDWLRIIIRKGDRLKEPIKHRLEPRLREPPVATGLLLDMLREDGYEFGPIDARSKICNRYDLVLMNIPLSDAMLRLQEENRRRYERIYGVSEGSDESR